MHKKLYLFSTFVKYSKKVFIDIQAIFTIADFETRQVIGLETCKHRKTRINKTRIKLLSENTYITLGEINYTYFKDTYINKLSFDLIADIQNYTNNKKTSLNASNPITFNNLSNNINLSKFAWHLKRFKELYESNSINNSINRFSDIVTRYIYLTIKDEVQTKEYLKSFFNNINLNLNIDERLGNTKSSMTNKAIFIYNDVLTKELFYKTYNKEEFENNNY
jgi:hypothetical protein